MVELRKRKTVEAPTQPPKKTSSKAASVSKKPAKATSTTANVGTESTDTAPAEKTKAEATDLKTSDETKPDAAGAETTAEEEGEVLNIAKDYTGNIVLSDGQDVTLQQLLDISVSGVILFTYPKANTPGCTTQACAFRDASKDLQGLGYAVYGLSRDSVKANSSFRTKYNLGYTLICDQDGWLIDTLGFGKPPKRTTRGVIVIKKDGKVLKKYTGGPAATLEAVWPVVKAEEASSAVDSKI